jgi:uncharacterized membrane protein
MFRLIFLSLILFLAGVAHLMDPFAFVNAIPLFVPYKLEIIYFTGVLEMILAVGLLWKKTRSPSALLTAGYFLFLLPIHLYVSLNVIPMFGYSDPLLLWGRTLFQFVFVYWAYSLRKV